MKLQFKNSIPHISAILLFIGISLTYFYPQLQGNLLRQSDHQNYLGMSKEITDFREQYGEETLWTNSMFGGMPSYQISAISSNIINSIKNLFLDIIPRPTGYLFFLMIGFYILLLCLNVNPWLAIIGSLAFGFSSFNMLYLATGHNAKTLALSFIPPLLGSLIYAYRKNFLIGAALLSVFTCLHLSANHFQMSYYFLYLLMAVLLFEFYQSYKDKLLPTFFKISAVLLVASLIGVLPTISNLIVTHEYGKQTTRGKSELTITADANSDKSNETDALDADYIKQYSLGYGEAWSLVIPNVKGGRMDYLGNHEEAMSKVPAKYQQTVSQQYSYWGEQYSSGGAFYFGASIFLLFLLSIFFVKDRIKWALLAVSALAILLSWKYNPLVDWFINHVPLFSKFRDTKMMLILVQISFPLLGFLFLNKLLKNGIDKKKFLYISGGAIILMLLFYIIPGVFFDFQSNAEIQNYANQLMKYASDPGTIIQINEINQGIIAARKVLFREDVLRSVFYILATSALIYLFMLRKMKQTAFLALLAVVIIADLWTVDKRYLNNDKKGSQYYHWVDSFQYNNPFQATVADAGILNNEINLNPALKQKLNAGLATLQKERKMPTTEFNIEKEKILFKELNFATNYRVFSLKDPFSNSRTSYFHKSIGGYHGAKLKNYQELIEFYISKEYSQIANLISKVETISEGMKLPDIPIPVLNMLNTKYIIADPGSPPILNPYHYGNAWFVQDIKFAASADEEMLLLKSMDKNTAILNSGYKAQIPKYFHADSTSHIQLLSYRPNHLTYESSSIQEGLAIFSEIYYKDGWNAYLDGKKTDYFKANYLLRAMNIPAGKHTIEFKFEPESYYFGRWLSNLGSVLIIVFVGGMLFFGYKKRHKLHL